MKETFAKLSLTLSSVMRGKGFLVSSFDTSSVVKVVYKIYLPFSLAISALFFVTLLVFVNICFSLPSVLRSARVVGWGVVTEI